MIANLVRTPGQATATMNYLAVDVGGTSTRAAIVAADGNCIGYGKAGSGNPTSSRPADAISSIIAATHAATAQSGSTAADLAAATVGIAGAAGDAGTSLHGELIRAGLSERLAFESDLLVAFYSGSIADEGYALVAGTGSAAVRLRGGRIEATCDGLGWLLGDGGSGFWIGHRAVFAASSALDNRGPSTALVGLVLAELGIDQDFRSRHRRTMAVLRSVVDAVYRMRPFELARFAPLAFQAKALGDDIARRIHADASQALTATLDAVVVPDITGPLVLSGSILSQPSVAQPVVQSSHPRWPTNRRWSP